MTLHLSLLRADPSIKGFVAQILRFIGGMHHLEDHMCQLEVVIAHLLRIISESISLVGDYGDTLEHLTW